MNLQATKLPPGWKWMTMGEIADVVGGGTPKTKDPTNFESGSLPWLTPADLSGYTEKHVSRGARSITQKGLDGSSAKLMPAGTVLFTSRAPIGYVAIAANPISTNQGFKSFVLKDGILPDYVYWWLKGSRVLAESLASGTTFLELSGAKAKQIPIPVAPIDQQAKIVAEIEKQFSRLDKAVTNLHRVKANLKRYKPALLKAAVEGKLTEEWRQQNPEAEPVSKLLERILAERRTKWEEAELAKMKAKGKEPKNNRWKEDYKAVAELKLTELLSLPQGWIWVRLEQILESLCNGISAKPDQDNGLAILRISAVRPLTVNLDDVRYLPSENATDYERYQLRDGDLLFTRYNGNPDFVGVCGVVKNISTFIVHPDKIIRGTVTNDDDTQPSYLELALNAGESRAYIASMVRTTAGQSGVSGADIKNVPVPLPPSEEQNLIVQLVEKEVSIIASTERHLFSLLQRVEQLRHSILKKSFSGEVSA